MIHVNSPFPPGLVAIAQGDLGRYVAFEQSMDALRVPKGTVKVRKTGPSVARNRNKLVEQYLKPPFEWICFVDDDQVIPPDTIHHLLMHAKPIVGALYSSRRPPFYPVVMARREGAHWYPHTWTELSKGQRLRQVVGAGTGCMLIRAEVFTRVPKPWFHATEWTDDLHFCDAATRAGVPIFIDTHAVIGHVSTHNVYPDLRGPGGAGVTIAIDDLLINLSDDSGAAAPGVEVTPGAEETDG